MKFSMGLNPWNLWDLSYNDESMRSRYLNHDLDSYQTHDGCKLVNEPESICRGWKMVGGERENMKWVMNMIWDMKVECIGMHVNENSWLLKTGLGFQDVIARKVDYMYMQHVMRNRKKDDIRMWMEDELTCTCEGLDEILYDMEW